MILTDRALSGLANLCFFLIFPIGLLYYEVTGLGLLPRFLGGWIGGITLLAFVMLAPVVFLRMLRSKHGYSQFTFYCLAFAGLLFVVGSWTIVHWLLSTSNSAAALQSMILLFYASVLFWVGLYLDIKRPSFVFFIKLGAILIFLRVLVFVIVTGDTMYNPQLYHVGGAEEAKVTYQAYSRAAFLVYIFFVALSRGLLMKSASFGIGLFVLVLLGTRSELYVFILMSPLFFFEFVRGSYIKKLGLGGLLALCATGFLFALNHLSTDFERQLAVFDLAKDQSWSIRENLRQENMSHIQEHYILGAYGSHFSQGGAGSYIHNWMSAWQNFGIAGFIFYALLALSAFAGSFIGYVKSSYENRVEWTVSLAASLGMLVLIIFSKSIFSIMPFFVWGFFAARLVPSTHRAEMR